MITTITQADNEQKDELLLALLESSLYGIMVLKSIYDDNDEIVDFEFVALNRAAEDVIGQKTTKGSRFSEVFTQAKNDGLIQRYGKVAKTGETQVFNSTYPYKQRDKRSGYRQKVVAHKNGVVVAFEELTLHLTEQSMADDEGNKYSALFNSMQQGFCIIEVMFNESGQAYDYRYLEINPSFVNQTRLSESAVGKTMRELVPNHEQHWYDMYGDVIKKRKPIQFEQEAVMINGWYEVYAMPVDNTTNRVAVIINDITSRKKAEKKAEQDRKNAMRALKSKQVFLSNMSHEIRTPLTAVIGFTEEILKTELTERQREYINAIKISGDAMLVLVNDILDLAKVDEGKLEFEEHPFHLDACIRNMLLLFETKIGQKRLSLVKHYDPTIPSVLLGDSTRLNQIILNLVSNAVKFTHEGEIIVSAKTVSQNKEKITIELSVSDTGIGIERDELNHIFETFRQANSQTAKLYGGTGLGLSIVKQLVEAQGGGVTVKSEQGKGSVFCVTLTFKKPISERDVDVHTQGEETGATQVLKSENEYRILVAEDVKLNQLLMRVVLANMGFKADIVSNGYEAVELLKQNHYDLILMDIQMPVMDGYEATKHIRSVLNNSTPIVALTADVTTTDVQKIKECGMDDYATKPIKQENLYNKIMEVIEGR